MLNSEMGFHYVAKWSGYYIAVYWDLLEGSQHHVALHEISALWIILDNASLAEIAENLNFVLCLHSVFYLHWF
jgi:hypothetical protein